MTAEEFRELALSFPGTEEAPHFERRAFKVTGRRIYTTMLEAKSSVNMVLSKSDQSSYCNLDKKHIYPVPNKWGEHGWTTFEIKHIDRAVIQTALESAYNAVIMEKKKGKRR
jgi:predicted DNA-binding protein (MmcQ/YjbR family)